VSYTESGRQCHRQSGISTSASITLVWNVLALIQIWRGRARYRRALAARSEYELQDMGTCRSSIAHEIGKPFWRA
jgi:uncharacterized protein YjiS (DUF1127 family)